MYVIYVYFFGSHMYIIVLVETTIFIVKKKREHFTSQSLTPIHLGKKILTSIFSITHILKS